MPKSFTSFSDQELLELVQEKDESAFSILYERYYIPLCKKAYQRIPFQTRVEEIVQDVFVNLWTKASLLDSGGNVKAYLYATLRNKVLHSLRTERNRKFYMKKLSELKEKKVSEKPQPLQTLYATETQETINRIIEQLSPQCRTAFKLSRFEQLSYKEIAQRMQISASTVEKHISKALRIFKEHTALHHHFTVTFILTLLLCS